MTATIFKKELTEMLRDGRFRWLSTSVLVLLGAAVLMGMAHTRDVQTQHETAQAAARQDWVGQGEKNPHSAVHYGTYAFKPTMALSAIDPGVDPYVGVSAFLEGHRQNQFEFRPAQDATAMQRFGQLTAATVLQLLIPLLVIVMGFSVFAGEREQGTLRQLMSLGISPGRLALGKALGVSGALAIVLVPAAVLGVVALTLATPGAEVAADAPRLAMMVGAYLLYFGVFVALSLAVSAKAPSSRLALVVLLGFWIVNGLVAPRAVTDVARSLYPSPSSFEFTTGIQAALADGLDGQSPTDARMAAYQQEVLAEYGVDSVDELPISFAGLRFQKSEEMGNEVFDYYYGGLNDTFESQNRVRSLSAVVAPLLAVQSLSMGLAGTDVAQHRHFSEAAEEYRRMYVGRMNEDIAQNAGAGRYVAEAGLWASVPEFDYQAPSVGWVLANHRLSILLLFAWLAVALTLAMRAASALRPV